MRRKRCRFCNRSYPPEQPHQKFCSPRCRRAYHYRKQPAIRQESNFGFGLENEPANIAETRWVFAHMASELGYTVKSIGRGVIQAEKGNRLVNVRVVWRLSDAPDRAREDEHIVCWWDDEYEKDRKNNTIIILQEEI